MRDQRVVDVPDIFQKDADQPGLAGGQAARGLIWNIVVFFQKSLDLFPRFLCNSVLPVDDAGDCAGGDSGFFCNVIDRHGNTSGRIPGPGTFYAFSLSYRTIGCNNSAYFRFINPRGFQKTKEKITEKC